MNTIRLTEGEYVAETPVTVALMQGQRQCSYYTVAAGETFTVPRHVNGFWSAAVYSPDFGDEAPKFRPVATAEVASEQAYLRTQCTQDTGGDY